jgi:hypothetical protein
VPFSRRFKLRSRHVRDDFVIDVALPAPYLPGAAPWPVLFVTDGNLAFATAAATMGVLPLEPGGPRPACVVGIGVHPRVALAAWVAASRSQGDRSDAAARDELARC